MKILAKTRGSFILLLSTGVCIEEKPHVFDETSDLLRFINDGRVERLANLTDSANDTDYRLTVDEDKDSYIEAHSWEKHLERERLKVKDGVPAEPAEEVPAEEVPAEEAPAEEAPVEQVEEVKLAKKGKNNVQRNRR